MILCSLILQQEDGSVVLYLKTIEEDDLEIITAGIQKPRIVDEFIEASRNQIWDYGYRGWFKGKEAYTRTKAFEDHLNFDLAVKRVIYRFGCNCCNCDPC